MVDLSANLCLFVLFAVGAAKNVSLYPAHFPRHLNTTPIYINSTGRTANPLIKALGVGQGLEKRESTVLPTGTCAPGTPCVNGACCGMNGLCGYAPLECSAATCLSNCDAKAECGEYAPSDSSSCPLNVCCSFFGFCGTTDDFCQTTGDQPCQDGYGSCGDVVEPSCASSGSINARTIGYYESWANTRICDTRAPGDLDLTGFSHINFAFAFFNPTTFEITPMDTDAATLYSDFTNLKSGYPGLQAYISVGGWSFNDAGNSPDTTTAFSDMVSSSENRAAFIKSLTSFMTTYGFDGVDLDWEYPAASDRGGVPADTANFVSLVKELRSAFGSSKGVTATLPSSFWYLQGFDVVGMADYVDWFNFMSYDIHGVWDAASLFTGPYIRPHTNWTEISQGLDLLWRAGVAPEKVTLGLGWYGRSFTLTDADCSTPNGVCMFSTGGNPGECTASSGTLSNSEIFAIIAEFDLVKTYDEVAAVNWVTWDETQWVSYDDGESMAAKLARANNLCLGGIMIWSIDQDNTDDDSMSDFLGIGPTNGISSVEQAEIKSALVATTAATSVASSCYWSFCGSGCDDAYYPVAQAKGEVANNGVDASVNTVCTGTEVQSLCCAPGTTLGTCQWEGWNGVGMPCTASCANESAIVIAENTNSYVNDAGTSVLQDQTCNGGFQAYCCLGFVASSTANTGSLDLVDQSSTKRDLQRRGSVSPGVRAVCLTVAEIAIEAAVALAAAFFTFGVSEAIFAATEAANVICLALAAAAIIEAAAAAAKVAAAAAVPIVIGVVAHAMILRNARPPSVPKPPTTNPRTGSNGGKTAYGQWSIASYPTSSVQTDCDCSVTYTCVYGMVATAGGWDEICDNQRWGIDQVQGGNTVYHYSTAGKLASAMYNKNSWKPSHAGWQSAAQVTDQNAINRCQVDEFPMGSLEEAIMPNPQACRLVNGPANGRQGVDWGQFILAQWAPCSVYKEAYCSSPNPIVPVTWAFNALPGNRLAGNTVAPHFIQAYGFDSQTAGSECWATASWIGIGGNVITSTVTDHGFRVLVNDPIITNAAYGWPSQSYIPSPFAGQVNQPSSIASAQYQKRQEALLILKGDLNVHECGSGFHLECEAVPEMYRHPHGYGRGRYSTYTPAVTTTGSANEATDVATKAGSIPQNRQPTETGTS